MADILPFPAKPTIEIYAGLGADPKFSDFGQRVYLVAVNETSKPYNGFIFWDGPSREEAWKEARELTKDYGARIVDLTQV